MLELHHLMINIILVKFFNVYCFIVWFPLFILRYWKWRVKLRFDYCFELWSEITLVWKYWLREWNIKFLLHCMYHLSHLSFLTTFINIRFLRGWNSSLYRKVSEDLLLRHKFTPILCSHWHILKNFGWSIVLCLIETFILRVLLLHFILYSLTFI